MSVWCKKSKKEKIDDWLTLEAQMLKPQARGGLPEFSTVEWRKNEVLISKVKIQKAEHHLSLRFNEYMGESSGWQPTQQSTCNVW